MTDTITLAHGSGGRLYHHLVEEVFLPAYGNEVLGKLGDAAVCPISGERIAMTTDSFVVQPLFFPGGDIGRLAVCGTVNDLAMSGARPLYLTVGMIIEAGFPLAELQQIVASIAAAAAETNTKIVTGDTKVVPKGLADGIYINTAGVGVFDEGQAIPQGRLAAGDKIIISGEIAQHGMAVMAAREKLDFQPQLTSDAAPLYTLVAELLCAAPHTRLLRDPTRGGVATVLNEWAEVFGCSIVLNEDAVPVALSIKAACELFGLDPLYVANEGKFLAAVPAEEADAALAALKEHELGRKAAIIGEVREAKSGLAKVYVETAFGGSRIIDMLSGEQLPRIC